MTVINPISPTTLTSLFLLALALLQTSCTGLYYYGPRGIGGGNPYLEGYDPADRRYSRQPVDNVSWWRGDGVPGTPHIVISLSKQEAYFYKSGRLVGVSAISSGDQEHRTPTGKFRITQKDQWHQSSQYGDYVDQYGQPIQKNINRHVDPMPPGAKYDGANMFYFMRIVRGIGLHAGYLPGYPASHGCIRMPQHMAQAFFRNVSVGTPVEVRY